MPEQGKDPAHAGPFHSFKVTHIVRPGHGEPGSSEVQSGHLNIHDALAWLRGIGKDHGLDARQAIHPAHGIPPEVAEAAGLEGTPAAAGAAAAYHQDELAEAAQEAAQGQEEAAKSVT